MADDEQLLMVAAHAPHPLVEEHLTACPVHRFDEVQVLRLTEMCLIGVGTPHESANVHAIRGQCGEHGETFTRILAFLKRHVLDETPPT